MAFDNAAGPGETDRKREGVSSASLVLNRGFMRPFCRRHMAQWRDSQEWFQARRAVVLVIGPEPPETFKACRWKHDLPFIGLPDPDHSFRVTV